MRRSLVVASLAAGAAAFGAVLVLTDSATPGGGRVLPATTAEASQTAVPLPASTRGGPGGLAATALAAVADVMMTPATFDPARISMKVELFQVIPPRVGEQCTGSLVIMNTGPGYEHDASHILPYWMLTIAEANGTQIHMGGGGWSGPMRTRESRTFRFDTHSNSVPEAEGRPFVFPKPGRYAITVSIFPGGNLLAPVDTRTITVQVAGPQ